MNKSLLYILIGLNAFLSIERIYAQEPFHFSYNIDNGLPSNEVYNLIMDDKGFVWMGCDAGLYKYNGVKYVLYRTQNQSTKSMNGLALSSSGRLYSYNFQSEIFYIENDSLYKLPTRLNKISRIVSDHKSRIYFNHHNGLSIYDENKNDWIHFEDSIGITHGTVVDDDNTGFTLTSGGFAYITGDSIELYFTQNNVQTSPRNFSVFLSDIGKIILNRYNTDAYLIKKNSKKFQSIQLNELKEALKGKTIIKVKILSDYNWWICTYNGVIRYNPHNGYIQTLFSDLSVSDVITDRENNYWFSTIQDGIKRIPNLDIQMWNKSHPLITDDRISKIDTDGTHIFIGFIDGHIGIIDTRNNSFTMMSDLKNKSIHSLNYDPVSLSVYINADNRLYSLQNGHITLFKEKIPPIKSFAKTNNRTKISATSFGTFINDKNVDSEWSRDVKYNVTSEKIAVATNQGVLIIKNNENDWGTQNKILDSLQMLSITNEMSSSDFFALSFDGKIFRITDSDAEFISKVPDSVQVHKLIAASNRLFISTNKGLLIYDLAKNQWSDMSTHQYFLSNNIHDFTVTSDALWVTTGSGLQRIPFNVLDTERIKARIYLKNEKIQEEPFEIPYTQSLLLYPEISHYNSRSEYQIAYRILEKDTIWTVLPGHTELLTISNLPTGHVTIELKAIDRFGIDSENTITLQGTVRPPFWRATWFIILVAVSIIALVVLTTRLVFRTNKKSKISNKELTNSQLKSLRAQMNPHVMFNTLNSIQALIIHNDFKNTNIYLEKFSLLMRQILAHSDQEKITIDEEVKMLHNYLELEKLRFGEDFEYDIHIDESIDSLHEYTPSLIIQPFVENAIKHGLLNAKGKKELNISFKKEKSQLTVSITDNGIGYKNSIENKYQNTEQSESITSDAVYQRISLLNKIGHVHIQVQIQDANATLSQPGTQVILTIK